MLLPTPNPNNGNTEGPMSSLKSYTFKKKKKTVVAAEIHVKIRIDL